MKYKIIKDVYLDFITPREQITKACSVGYVLTDKGTSWYVDEWGSQTKTINTDWVIQEYINKGHLEFVEDGRACDGSGIDDLADYSKE
jgi:hypothetical protein